MTGLNGCLLTAKFLFLAPSDLAVVFKVHTYTFSTKNYCSGSGDGAHSSVFTYHAKHAIMWGPAGLGAPVISTEGDPHNFFDPLFLMNIVSDQVMEVRL